MEKVTQDGKSSGAKLYSWTVSLPGTWPLIKPLYVSVGVPALNLNSVLDLPSQTMFLTCQKQGFRFRKNMTRVLYRMYTNWLADILINMYLMVLKSEGYMYCISANTTVGATFQSRSN